MTTTSNLSLNPEHSIAVEHEGWGKNLVGELHRRAQLIAGVTRVASAGGGLSTYVYYEPATISEASLLSGLRGVAKALLPHHPFGW